MTIYTERIQARNVQAGELIQWMDNSFRMVTKVELVGQTVFLHDAPDRHIPNSYHVQEKVTVLRIETVYDLAEIRDGTGFSRTAQFVQVRP